MKFPQATTVIQEFLQKDAQYALDVQAFLAMMSDVEPDHVEYDVSDKRAVEIIGSLERLAA